MCFVLGIDIKLHPVVLPLLSPLGRSLRLHLQLGPIEVLVEMSMTRWWFGIVLFNTYEIPCKCLKLIGKAQLHCPGIGRNADDWAVVSVSALYGASVAAYAEKTPVRV